VPVRGRHIRSLDVSGLVPAPGGFIFGLVGLLGQWTTPGTFRAVVTARNRVCLEGVSSR
jgi:hypothetical protein